MEDTKRNFPMERGVKPWQGLPMLECPSLEVNKEFPDVALSALG